MQLAIWRIGIIKHTKSPMRFCELFSRQILIKFPNNPGINDIYFPQLKVRNFFFQNYNIIWKFSISIKRLAITQFVRINFRKVLLS